MARNPMLGWPAADRVVLHQDDPVACACIGQPVLVVVEFLGYRSPYIDAIAV